MKRITYDKITHNEFKWDKQKQIYTIDSIDDLIVDAYGMHFLGSTDRPFRKCMAIVPINEEHIETCLIVVEQLAKIQRMQNKASSYKLKYLVSKLTNIHCSNGSLIAAMIEQDFNVWTNWSLEAYFNISLTSLKKIQKKI